MRFLRRFLRSWFPTIVMLLKIVGLGIATMAVAMTAIVLTHANPWTVAIANGLGMLVILGGGAAILFHDALRQPQC